jgi:uncharacterized protein YkwD
MSNLDGGRAQMRKLVCGGAVVMVALVVAAVVMPEPARAFDRKANERAVLRLINRARAKRHLATLHVRSPLHRAALAHSRQMVARDYFSHCSASGVSLATRLRKAGYGTSGYSSWSVGEVLGWVKGLKGTPRAVFKAWMKSKAHRRVIFGKRWRDVGVGCARGTFCGMSNCVVYTVDVGRRSQ